MDRLTKSVIAYVVCLLVVSNLGCASSDSKRSLTQAEKTRMFVVRHAEAYKNLPQTRTIPKEKLDSLTSLGMQQAKECGMSLNGKGIVAVVTLPTGRTRETARIISEQLGLKGAISEDSAFFSMRKGITPDGRKVTWWWREAQWAADRDPRPKGGESLEDAARRVTHAVELLVQRYSGKGVVIVTHSDICAGLAGHAMNTPFPQRYAEHKVGLGEVVKIVIDAGGTWALP
jgi:broad specificity phosphatase PhoE